MRSQDIPIREWPSFFGRFSRLHEGALVTMSVSAPDTGAIDAMRDEPFAGISSDGDELIVHVGAHRERPRLEHRILHVDSVRIQQTDEGADAEIDIDAMDGIRTIVRFRSPMQADLLDPGVE